MERLILLLGAALLAWVGARWTRGWDEYYAHARRAIPARTAVIVALATGATGVGVWQQANLVSAAWVALWCVVLALVAAVDIETHFIPNPLILPALLAALGAAFVDPRTSPLITLLGAAMGLGCFALFYLLAGRLAPGGLGMGDVTLATFVGAIVGFPAALYALLAGILLGGLLLLLLLATRRITLKSYVPYGPYLCLGGWLGLLPAVLHFWGLV